MRSAWQLSRSACKGGNRRAACKGGNRRAACKRGRSGVRRAQYRPLRASGRDRCGAVQYGDMARSLPATETDATERTKAGASNSGALRHAFMSPTCRQVMTRRRLVWRPACRDDASGYNAHKQVPASHCTRTLPMSAPTHLRAGHDGGRVVGHVSVLRAGHHQHQLEHGQR